MWGKKFVEEAKVTIFYNAIDLNKFKRNEEMRTELRKQLHINDKFVIGHIGRFCYQKNQEFLIDILKKVKEKKENAVLMFIGEGSTMPDIKEKVNKAGLFDSVIFLGVRDDVNFLCQAMDVFVLPSRYEGLGMVAIEAQAVGIPTIVSTEIPEEAKVTNLIEFLDLNSGAEDWAEKLLSIDLEKEKKDFILEECYNITNQADNLREFYEKIYRTHNK